MKNSGGSGCIEGDTLNTVFFFCLLLQIWNKANTKDLSSSRKAIRYLTTLLVWNSFTNKTSCRCKWKLGCYQVSKQNTSTSLISNYRMFFAAFSATSIWFQNLVLLLQMIWQTVFDWVWSCTMLTSADREETTALVPCFEVSKNSIFEAICDGIMQDIPHHQNCIPFSPLL